MEDGYLSRVTGPCPIQPGGPDFRSPDYTSLTIGGPWIGINKVTDRYGNVYATIPTVIPPGLGWKYGISYTYGWMSLSGRKPTPEELSGFIRQLGIQGCAGVVVGGCETWSPGSGTATEFGFMTPQVGVSGGWTVETSHPNTMEPLPPAVERRVATPVGQGIYVYNFTPY